MDLIKSGTSTGTVETGDTAGQYYRTGLWKIINTTAASTVVVFSDRDASKSFTVTIPATNTAFVDVYGDFQKMVVSSGNVSYLIYA